MIACSATDPGVDGLTRANLAATPVGDSGAQPGKDGGVGPNKDGGGNPLDSSMAPDANTTTDAFTGAGAYASGMPTTSAVTYHQNNGVNTTPGKGVACLGCHNGNAKDFLFGGTVFKDKAGTVPAANVEVRVRGSDGTGYLTHSDADGNFWLAKNNNTIMTPALTGVRDSMKTSLMSGNITDTNCNSCHDSNNTDAIHLP